MTVKISHTRVAALAALMLSIGSAASNAEVAPAADAASQETTQVAPAAETAAPSAAEAPVETTAPASTASVTAKDLAVGSAVFGSDGEKIGEINRVASEPSGTVTEIQVTTGGKAGLGAEVVVIPADKIADISGGVKLSLSSQEAKSLPVIDTSSG